MKKIAILIVSLIMPFGVGGVAVAQVTGTECIAPAGVGGGWDFTCRVPAAQVMKDLGLIGGSMEVVNMSGAGGATAFAYVVTKRKGDEKLIVAASMATATRLAQNVYAGFNSGDVRWLGALGADYGVIAVAKDSEYKTLDQLIEGIKKSRVNFVGGSAAGGWDHLKALILADKAGIKDLGKVQYVAFDNGSKAMIEIISGRAQAFTGDTSEVLSQLDAGAIRVLAVLAPERVERLGNAKTAKEQGYDVIGANWRGFYAPNGISEATYNQWVDIIKKVSASDEWNTLRENNGLAKFESFGADFETFLNGQIELVKQISTDLGFMQ